MATVARRPGTDRHGREFPPATVEAVWRKGRPIPGYSPAEWRADMCGAPMSRREYGNTASRYGWEIDHIVPIARGGTDDLQNLQPLQWENNRRKGDKSPWYCGN